MNSFPSWLLPIIEQLVQRLIAEAVNSDDAKRALVIVLSTIKAGATALDAKASGPLKWLADDLTTGLDTALDGVIAGLQK